MEKLSKRDYRPGDTIYILLKKIQAESVMEEWLDGGWSCDLRIRRSQKTKGHVVLETKDLMFAVRCIRYHEYERVVYKRN